MSKAKAVRFGCPDCQEAVKVDYLAYIDGELRLVAKCDQCQTPLNFDLNHCIANLFDGAYAPTKGGKPS